MLDQQFIGNTSPEKRTQAIIIIIIIIILIIIIIIILFVEYKDCH
jgi:threonine/homoserine/homoserine lactone efflux protein